METTKEVRLTFTHNGKKIPVNGELSHKYDSKGNLTLKFAVGTTKLDHIELKLENLNYVEEIKDDRKESSDNN